MAFVMVLSYSRAIFLRFFLDARMDSFLRGHVEAFAALGVARVLLYDNLKSAVLERVGDAIRFNPELPAFAVYLSYSNRHADLLFELVSRRYQHKSTVITTNRAFAEWGEVFPNAACVVSLVDRLMHLAEVVRIEGNSYRAKEAEERVAARVKQRNVKPGTGSRKGKP